MKHEIFNWTSEWASENHLHPLLFEEITSTNQEAKKLALKNFSSPQVFLAKKQTEGRGRKNHIWFNSDLMMSWLWQKKRIIPPTWDQDFAKDLFFCVKKIWPSLPWSLKEPNDIYLKNKKVGGILLEIVNQQPQTGVVLGLGFNVFSKPIKQATHLSSFHCPDKKSWQKFLTELHNLWNKRALEN